MSMRFWIQSIYLEKPINVNKWIIHNQNASNSLPDVYSDMWYGQWIYFGLQVIKVYSLFKSLWDSLDQPVLSNSH